VSDALWGLCIFAAEAQGVQAILDADVIDVFPELLNSRDAKVREWTAKLLEALAKDAFALNLILSSRLCAQLVPLSRRVKFPMLQVESDADYPPAMASAVWS
jgi:hypothetical protein